MAPPGERQTASFSSVWKSLIKCSGLSYFGRHPGEVGSTAIQYGILQTRMSKQKCSHSIYIWSH